MKEKDLQNGLNHIEDELIEEAAKGFVSEEVKTQAAHTAADEKGKRTASPTVMFRKRIMPIVAAAAVVCVAVLGGVTIRQSQQIAQLQGTIADLSGDGAASSGQDGEGNNALAGAVGDAGIAKLGDAYTAAQSYEEVYDAAYDASAQEQHGIGWWSGSSKEAAAVDAGDTTGAVYETEDIASADIAVPNSGTGAAAKEYSTTNVVTEGVDESDIVKTDGKYIYMVKSGSIGITDIKNGKPGAETSVTIPLIAPSDAILEMYVADQKLTVLASHIDKESESTYAYIYDITDPTHPELTGQMHQDGSYKTSRLIGGTVYLFSEKMLCRPQYDKTKATTDENLTKWIPRVNDCIVDYGCIFLPETGYQGLLISTFSTDKPDTVIDAKYIVNDYAQVYVSQSAVYLYSMNYNNSRTVTDITKIAFSDGKLTEGESTSVSGQITDTFAINEKNGYLRVLTTDYAQSVEVNTLYVLDDQLKQTGRIDEIARGESIYAARYVGDLVYFITYKNTDPLFCADLSDPAAPKLLGELEVKGFSEYLHQWDETHILGIGYENEDEDNGVLLTMFDVTDPANPKVCDQVALPGESYSSAVNYEYKAILASPQKGLVGFPVTTYRDTKNDEWEILPSYELYRYDEKKGFSRCLSQELIDESGYRGLYSGDDFYIAGNGKIFWKKLK